MIYTFDTSSMQVLGNYYPDRFPTFWERFEEVVSQGNVISVREVRTELDGKARDEWYIEWIKKHGDIFLPATAVEGQFVAEIFAIPHFQTLVGQRQQMAGKPVADPFIIASAKCRGGTVVTEEGLKPNAAKIP